MTRGIFIAGNESALSRAIEAETTNRVEQFAAAYIPNRLAGAVKNSTSETPKRLSLEWNPSSPISARTLVLAAENRLEHIDEAILICSPPSVRCKAADLSFSDVEIMLNDHIKGWFFLIKELISVFNNRRRGSLVLVYPDIPPIQSRDEAADILGQPALASFRTMTQSLLSSAQNEAYTTMAFSTSDAGNETAFASFLYKSLDESSKRSNGKLHKFGKFNLFK
ncbi:MAG: hypothetical protein LBC76_02390 [Treponema sp.]|jgi:hypothetical protein|nr:hypothetical protein [Treponema sp.]